MNKKHTNKEKGFTLVELILVIIILGVLAAYAVPKYMDLRKEAAKLDLVNHKKVLEHIARVVHAQAVTQGLNSGLQKIEVEGETVEIYYGYPLPRSIDNALRTGKVPFDEELEEQVEDDSKDPKGSEAEFKKKRKMFFKDEEDEECMVVYELVGNEPNIYPEVSYYNDNC